MKEQSNIPKSEIDNHQHRNGTDAGSIPSVVTRVNDGYPRMESRFSNFSVPEDSDSLDFKGLIVLLHRRRRIMLTIFLPIVILAALYSWLKHPIYRAEATLLVNTNKGNMGQSDFPLLGDLMGLTQARSLETEIQIVQSRAIQDGAMKRLQPSEREVAEKYHRIQVESVRDTDVITITAMTKSQSASIALAQAVSDEFISQNRDKNREETRVAADYVQGQLVQVRKQLNNSRDALRQFKQKSGVVDLPTEIQGRIAQVAQTESDLRSSQADHASALSQLARLKALAQGMAPTETQSSTIVRSSQVDAMQQRLTQLELDRLAAIQEYTPTSEEVTKINGQINVLRKQLAGAVQTEVASQQRTVNPVRQNLQQNIATLQGQIWAFEARIKALSQNSNTLKSALKGLPAEEYRLAQLETDADLLQNTYQILNEKYQQLRISEEGRLADAIVIDKAALPAPPQSPIVSPRRFQNMVAAILFGAILSFGVALLIDRLDDRVHSEEDAVAGAHIPVLTHVPFITDENEQSLVGNTERTSQLLESYRMLRTNIMFSGIDRPVRSILVSSSQPNEGKSVCSLNLAVVMALGGKRVIVVDCDLRRPTMHRLLGLSNQVGFASVVAGLVPLQDALQDTQVPNLRVLTAGPQPPNPPELLDSRSGRKVLQQVMEIADFVIYDTPPCLLMADAQIVATIADAAILVISCREAGKREIARTSELLKQTGIKVLGSVLNKVIMGIDTYYSYYNSYSSRYYSRYFSADTDESSDGAT